MSLCRAIDGRESELGFIITPAVTETDLDFADDIALLSDEVEQAQELLRRIESECKRVGLCLNAKKTEVIYINTPEHEPLKLIDGRELKEASDFKYLGSWVNSTEGDIKIRKAKAWKALNDMKKIWNSAMSREVKISFFLATVESVLFYGCETWSLTHSLKKSLNGCYTRMLQSALGISWPEKVSNVVLYGDLPRVGNKIAACRMQLAGHCQ